MAFAIIERRGVKSLDLELLRRKGLVIKYRVKTTNKDQNGNESFIHKNIVYGKDKANISLNFERMFIEIDISDESRKCTLLINEVARVRLLQKLNNLIGLVEAYYGEDIDVLVTGMYGTQINPKLKDVSNVSFKIGRNNEGKKSNLVVGLVYLEEIGDVKVALNIDGIDAVISLYDFLDLVYKIKNLNFQATAIAMLNYIGRSNDTEATFRVGDGGQPVFTPQPSTKNISGVKW